MAAKKAKRGPGRPSKGVRGLVHRFQFKVSKALLDSLEAAARKLKMPARTLVRRIVEDWLKRPRKLG